MRNLNISRREFIKIFGITAIGGLLGSLERTARLYSIHKPGSQVLLKGLVYDHKVENLADVLGQSLTGVTFNKYTSGGIEGELIDYMEGETSPAVSAIFTAAYRSAADQLDFETALSEESGALPGAGSGAVEKFSSVLERADGILVFKLLGVLPAPDRTILLIRDHNRVGYVSVRPKDLIKFDADAIELLKCIVDCVMKHPETRLIVVNPDEDRANFNVLTREMVGGRATGVKFQYPNLSRQKVYRIGDANPFLLSQILPNAVEHPSSGIVVDRIIGVVCSPVLGPCVVFEKTTSEIQYLGHYLAEWLDPGIYLAPLGAVIPVSI